MISVRGDKANASARKNRRASGTMFHLARFHSVRPKEKNNRVERVAPRPRTKRELDVRKSRAIIASDNFSRATELSRVYRG